MSSYSENRKLLNYYEEFVKPKVWPFLDRNAPTDQRAWQMLYRVHLARQQLDIWDMEKNTYQGHNQAAKSLDKIVGYFDDIITALESGEITIDNILNFTFGVGRAHTQHNLKDIIVQERAVMLSLRYSTAPALARERATQHAASQEYIASIRMGSGSAEHSKMDILLDRMQSIV